MSYTVRRWLSSNGFMIDDSRKAKDAEEAIITAEKLAGICKDLITDETRQKIRELQEGETLKFKRKSLGFSMIVRRTKR